jgi:hypothetical protein
MSDHIGIKEMFPSIVPREIEVQKGAKVKLYLCVGTRAGIKEMIAIDSEAPFTLCGSYIDNDAIKEKYPGVVLYKMDKSDKEVIVYDAEKAHEAIRKGLVRRRGTVGIPEGIKKLDDNEGALSTIENITHILITKGYTPGMISQIYMRKPY